MCRKFSRDTEENIYSELSEINWDLAMRNCGDNADAGFSKFFNSLNKIVNKHAPLRPLAKRKAKQFSKPCIPRGIRMSIKVKNTLFASGDFENYKHYRNKILTHVRCSKKLYYHSYFNDHMKNVRKTWIGIIISSAEIKEDVSLLSRFLMCSMNSFLPWVKHLRHQYLLLIIISVIISLLLIHLVHSSLSRSLPWNLKLKFFFSRLTNHMVYTPVPFAY